MFQIKGGRSRSLTLSQQRTMTLGGPIFSRMTNEIDQDGISLSAGPDCNRRWPPPPPPPPLRRPRGATRARGREKDHRGGVVGREGRGSGENKFRISCRIGRPRRGEARRSGNRSLLNQFVRGHFFGHRSKLPREDGRKAKGIYN